MFLSMGINVLGSHLAVLAWSLVPQDCECEAAYREMWSSIIAAYCAIISLPDCGKTNCTTCCCIRDIREQKIVKDWLSSELFELKELVNMGAPISDNSTAFQNFAKNVFGVSARVCQTHMSGACMWTAEGAWH